MVSDDRRPGEAREPDTPTQTGAGQGSPQPVHAAEDGASRGAAGAARGPDGRRDAGDRGPRWYQNPVIVSFTLPAISILVAVLSPVVALAQYSDAQQQARRQYETDRRAQLSEYVQQLVVLTTNGESDEEEVSTLASEAIVIVPTVPNVSATVYRQIAEAMAFETVYLDQADRLADQAISRAAATGNRYEEIAAHRVKANIRQRNRDLEGMRGELRAALELATSYQGPNRLLRYDTASSIELQWARAELGSGNCDAARQHQFQAASYTGQMVGDRSGELFELQESIQQACAAR